MMAYIAIVEDEKNICKSLRLALEAEGYVVDDFQDPLIALPKLICVPPNLLILNGYMPGMHGIAFFQKFREYSSAPVMFISANAEEIQDTLESMGMTAEAYVAKPFSQRLIVGYAKRLLRGGGQVG